MTVAELITILQDQPPELPVYCVSDFYEEAFPLEPHKVTILHIDPHKGQSQAPKTVTPDQPANALVIGW